MRILYTRKVLYLLIMFCSFSLTVFAQVKVEGKVVDEKGSPLPGATVTERGTRNAVATDNNGHFVIRTNSAKPILIASMIGFSPVELNAEGTTVTFQLSPEKRDLNEVVVIGYGTQKKKDLTGSLASVNAKDIEKITTSSVDKALQGQLAGVQISNTSGAPGGSTNVYIRGISSITGSTQPLYVIDGYPVTNTGNGNPLNTIDPNEIQSVDVLKDASAAAIYGSRASNGVIIITTKRGKEGKTRVDVNAYTGVQQVAKQIKMMNAQQFIQFVIDGRNAGYLDNVPTGNISDPNSKRPASYQIDPRFTDPNFVSAVGNGTNWQDAIFRNARINNYEVAVSGGNSGLLYSISGGYFNQDGIVIRSNLKRYSFKANLDGKINEKFSLGASFLPSYVTQFSPPITGHYGGLGVIQSALAMDPTIPVYNPDGSYGSSIGTLYGTAIQNPVKIANEYNNLQSQFRLLANSYAEYAIIPSLKLKTTFGADLNYFKTRVYSPSTLSSTSATTLATASAANNEATNWLSETTLSYSKLFTGKHKLDALAGFTAQQAYFDNTTANATNFPNDLVQNINGGVVNSGSEFIAKDTQLSWLGRVNYAYADKYLLTATIRSDASSKFGSNKRWGTFPSASIGWRISQEKFMQNQKLISDWKLRAGYGVTGNNAISSYQALSVLGTTNYVIGNALASGTSLATLSNPDLSWETQTQVDIGTDIGLLNNRIYVNIDVYDKRNKDMLFSVPTAGVTGFTSATVNLGEVQNKGLEIALNTVNFTGAFKWNTNFNIAFNRNKVLAMNTATATILGTTGGRGNTNITEVGQPIGVFFGLKALGVFNTPEEAAAYKAQPFAKAGDIKFQDTNNDGKIDANDNVIIGNPQPKYNFGFNNSLSYKNFSLDINTTGQVGSKIYSALFAINNSAVQNNAAFIDEARWRSASDPGTSIQGSFGRTIRGGKNSNTQYSSLYIFDGSYFRISQVNLGYNLPGQWIKKMNIKSARIYAGVNNLYTFTKYFGYDPEVGNAGVNAGSQDVLGVDFGTYPTARTFTLGLNLSL